MLFLKTVPPVLCSILRYIVLDYVQRGQLFTRIYILSIYEKDRFKKNMFSFLIPLQLYLMERVPNRSVFLCSKKMFRI